MEKISIGIDVFIYPMPVVLVGSLIEEKANFMPLAWMTSVSLDPPMLAVVISKSNYTTEGIRQNETFSVNVPSADTVEKTDYCGLVSGRKTDKSSVFEVFFGELETAPMIKECTLCLECKLVDTVEIHTNNLFIGEITASFTEERYLSDGRPDIHKMNSMLLTMPDKNYRTVGESVGKAWNIGQKLK